MWTLNSGTMVRSFWKVVSCCSSSTDDIAAAASLPSDNIEDLVSVNLFSAVLSFKVLSAEVSLDFDFRLITSAAWIGV